MPVRTQSHSTSDQHAALPLTRPLPTTWQDWRGRSLTGQSVSRRRYRVDAAGSLQPVRVKHTRHRFNAVAALDESRGAAPVCISDASHTPTPCTVLASQHPRSGCFARGGHYGHVRRYFVRSPERPCQAELGDSGPIEEEEDHGIGPSFDPVICYPTRLKNQLPSQGHLAGNRHIRMAAGFCP